MPRRDAPSPDRKERLRSMAARSDLRIEIQSITAKEQQDAQTNRGFGRGRSLLHWSRRCDVRDPKPGSGSGSLAVTGSHSGDELVRYRFEWFELGAVESEHIHYLQRQLRRRWRRTGLGRHQVRVEG